MSFSDAKINEWLLDEQLGRLSAEDRVRLADALRARPGSSARRGRLQRILAPLDSWSVPSPPANLPDRILSHVAGARQRDGLNLPTDGVELTGGRNRSVVFKLRDLVAVAAAIALLGVIFVPSLTHVRAKSRQIACATNLGMIGRGLASYAGDNHDQLPIAHAVPGARWLRTSDRSGPFSPNRRNTYLLLRYGYVGRPEAYVCPSCRTAKPMLVSNPAAMDDFPDARNCSYHSLNMGGPTPRFGDAPDQVYIADANPLFVGARFNRVNPESPSPNHPRLLGQNVLRIDGRADWAVTPRFGPGGDNIWQAGAVRLYKGVEIQRSVRDTFLIP